MVPDTLNDSGYVMFIDVSRSPVPMNGILGYDPVMATMYLSDNGVWVPVSGDGGGSVNPLPTPTGPNLIPRSGPDTPYPWLLSESVDGGSF